jgi:hypothetical protein
VESTGAEDTDRGTTRNEVSGHAVIHGPVVQAGVIENIRIGPAQQVTPRQVPPPRRGFVNRRQALAELAAIATADADGPPGIVLLSGMAGIGKTALVAEWTWRHTAECFPGGHLYTDLTDVRRDGGADVATALGELLLALGTHKDFVPPTLAGRAAAFRSATARSRVLVVVDGVQHPAEVRPFLPGNGLLVALSRTRLPVLVAVDGAREVPLEPLDAAAAESLVRRWCAGRDDEPAVRRLVELSHGMPLALDAIATRIVARPHVSLEAVVSELGDADAVDPAFPLFPFLDAAHTGFAPHTRELYAFLGAFPGSVFTDELVAAAGLPRHREAVGDLLTGNLAVVSPGSPSHRRLHGNVLAHARARVAGADGTAPWLAAVLDFYLATLDHADRLVLRARYRLCDEPAGPAPGGPRFADGAEALAWLDAERPNLLPVLRAAERAGRHEAVWRMCDALWAYFHSRKTYADWLDAYRLGVLAAQWDGRLDAEARMRNYLARGHHATGDLVRAEEEAARAGALLDAVTEPRLRGVVWETQGLVAMDRARPEAAQRLFRRALAANEGDPHGVALQGYNLAQAQLAAGAPERALETLAEAEAIARAADDLAVVMRIGIVAARAHRALGALDAAVPAIVRAADLADRLDLKAKLDQALRLAAQLAEEAGDEPLRDASRRKLAQLRAQVGLAAPPQE